MKFVCVCCSVVCVCLFVRSLFCLFVGLPVHLNVCVCACMRLFVLRVIWLISQFVCLCSCACLLVGANQKRCNPDNKTRMQQELLVCLFVSFVWLFVQDKTRTNTKTN